jgi:hypothetical protein
MTLVIAPPAPGDAVPKGTTLRDRVEQLVTGEGLAHKAALKQAAREFGLPRREAYKQLLLDDVSPEKSKEV